MLTHAQLQEQCKLIKRMLEVSPYFDGVTVTVGEHDGNTDVFNFGGDAFIEVRYDPGGCHSYLPGYNNQVGGFGSEPPSIEEVYFGKCRSLHDACVRAVSRIYEDQLQIEFERDEPKSHADYEVFDQTG